MFRASSTATGQNYRNGVGSGYAMRTYKDLDKGYYSSPPLQTTLYNNIPYFIKTKLVSAADSNVVVLWQWMQKNKWTCLCSHT
jgi:hypothetical protein